MIRTIGSAAIGVVLGGLILVGFMGNQPMMATISPAYVSMHAQIDALKAERDAATDDLRIIRTKLTEVCAVPEFKNLKVWTERGHD